jgi:hypothetical protein
VAFVAIVLIPIPNVFIGKKRFVTKSHAANHHFQQGRHAHPMITGSKSTSNGCTNKGKKGGSTSN